MRRREGAAMDLAARVSTGDNPAVRIATLVLAVLALTRPTVPALAEEASHDGAPRAPWSYGLDAALWIVPDESDFVQPTITADHARLHLEARYNYEDLESVSLFAGAVTSFGGKAPITIAPMIGGVVGQTDGVVPALEAELAYKSFEAYAEAEYLFDFDGSSSNFFYMWSEMSVAPVERLRAGVAAQRTRAYESARDVNYGLFVRSSFQRLEATVYGFDAGGDDLFMIVSFGLSF